MSSSIRQSELFASQDWQVLYRAFTNINFNASDPPSIAASLREYIRTNYAEDFNDWIASSEFVALIDLLAWLAGTIAFKTDINTRENFLETAEARESILRLARFLSYSPRRNQPANGLLKLQSIQTDDDVYDALGNNLQNNLITWDDPDDADWFEKTVLILNSAFVSSNPFGLPLKNGTLNSVKTQQYRLNCRFGDADLTYTAKVAGQTVDFEVINTDFDPTQGIRERTPDMESAIHLLYQADGNGNSSASTGFFIGFRQGTLKREQFAIDNPTENQIIDIAVDNINEADVWVQTLDEITGDVVINWQKVPAILSENITYNNLSSAVRNIFAVVTKDNDQISLRFSDGRFGTAPVGRLRTWYRVSNGLQYQIRPADMAAVSITIPYYSRRNTKQNLTLSFSLEDAVSNSAPRETDEQIKQRAPQVYAAQNRMVSGEDYNTFPLQSNLALKIKALSRVYSGQSKFLDLDDPTGSYQDTVVFSDDGSFFKWVSSVYSEVALSTNRTAEEMVSRYISPALQANITTNYVSDFLIQQQRAGSIVVDGNTTWNRSTNSTYSSTGWFSSSSAYMLPGALVQFTLNGLVQWVAVTNLTGDVATAPATGVAGPVTLAQPVETGATVTAIIPRYASTLSSQAYATIINRLNQRLSFSLWYDFAATGGLEHWVVKDPTVLRDANMVQGTLIKIMTADFIGGQLWRFSSIGLRYVFQSTDKVRFYFDGKKAIDVQTGQEKQDTIKVLRVNPNTAGNGGLLSKDYSLSLNTMYYNEDGYADPTRIVVNFADDDDDGYADDPDAFYKIISQSGKDNYLFWLRDDASGSSVPVYYVQVFENAAVRSNTLTLKAGTIGFEAATSSFWQMTSTTWIPLPITLNYQYAIGRGPNVGATYYLANGTRTIPQNQALYFQWKHYAPSDRRIDPSKSNIIDMFVMTNEYDYLVRQWVQNGAILANLPVPPTELALRTSFSTYEDFKMFSDEIVWRPVRYKYLFGVAAEAEVVATFKVVRLTNSAVSDGEIKTRVINAVNGFFAANLWDFGETFYFTELAAYVHQQLATYIASFVVVPSAAGSSFGDGFEVSCRSDELFISTAQVTDVSIINSNTPNNLRMS